ncbi:peptide methionine sulfoxide reductase-like isoform X1 [Carica papaya]|uniref:peptide methionine sulfoxide reductase-like isoform X1 n=1 Tax=Carica papaya TaxID=3649 RepID=UPI000B8C978B|nr:peptide methionine sulfoxide reductase-like isoform X1 [Carica papaya]
MYKLLPQLDTQVSDLLISKTTSPTLVPSNFLREAVFAGGSFLDLEAALGAVNGIVKTATGYCGGTLKKPTYREVREGKTGHTEAVMVIYDTRKVSYEKLCDIFWETHDPTNRDHLNFGVSGHRRSAIFYGEEEERKQAQKSKIRRQMKLNRRILTRLMELDSVFYMAENEHQKYHLQKNYRLCGSLSLRSTHQFAESTIACKLNGILGMNGKETVDELRAFLKSNELAKEAVLVCEETIEEISKGN